MVIGVLQFELLIPSSCSLKDKRRVVRSLKDRLRRRLNVSIAEVAALDHHRLAMLGLTAVSNSATHVNGVLDRVLDMVRRGHDAELGECTRELLYGQALPGSDSQIHDAGSHGEPAALLAEERDVLSAQERAMFEARGEAVSDVIQRDTTQEETSA